MRAAYGATSAAYGAAQTGPSASARLGAARNAGTSPSGGLATAPLRGALSPAAPRSPLAAQRFAFAPGPSAHRAAAEAEIAQRGATVAHRNEAYERALEALRGREGGNEAPLVTPSTPYETHVRALATEALGLQFGALAHQEAASGADKAQAAAQAAADGKENVIVRELVLPHEKHAARIRRGGADEGEEEGVGVVFAAAVVGLRWGDLVTVPALRRAGLPVVALADADAQLRDDAAQRHGVVEAVAGVSEALAARGARLAYLMVPPAEQRGALEEALSAGEGEAHVVVGAPGGADEGDAKAMLELVSGKGGGAAMDPDTGRPLAAPPKRLVMVDYSLRHSRCLRRMRAWADSGRLGVIVRAECHMIGGLPGLYSGGTLAPHSWRDEASKGGGALRVLGAHALDALRFVLRSEVVAAAATLRTLKSHLPGPGGARCAVTADDYANVAFEFDGGTHAAVVLSRDGGGGVGGGGRGERFVHFAGEAAAMTLDLEAGEARLVDNATGVVIDAVDENDADEDGGAAARGWLALPPAGRCRL